MIFLTIGTQLGFDRLVRAVDRWAAATKRDDVVGQIGDTSYRPTAIKWQALMEPSVFEDHCRRASLIIAHAGVGSILTALQLRKPIVVMPRRSSLGEHRNDHQLGTVRQFAANPGLYVAGEEDELLRLLEEPEALIVGEGIEAKAGPRLISALREFIAPGVAGAKAGAAVPHPAGS